MTYAARMGFFKSIGFNFGSAQPQVIAGIAYQPIQILTSSEIQNAAELQCVPIGEVLEQHADRLAEMLPD